MKVWITKYALTQGIQEWEVTQSVDTPTMVHANGCVYFHGNEWHKTETGAFVRAVSMRGAKIKSLRGQLTKLEGLEFK